MSHEHGVARARIIGRRKVCRDGQMSGNGEMCGSIRAIRVAGVGCWASGQVSRHVARTQRGAGRSGQTQRGGH